MLACVASAALAAPALAQEVSVSGNVAIGTDYVWRGITQSNEDMAISGGFDLEAGNFYAGTWASNVDFEDSSDTNIELDFYGGFTGDLSETVSWDVGMIYYTYPDADDLDYDFLEIYGGLSTELEGGLGLSGYLYWDPDNENIYVEAAAGYSFTDTVGVDASVGNYSFDGGGDYTAFSLGLGVATPVGLDLDFRFWSADASGVDDSFVFTVSKAL